MIIWINGAYGAGKTTIAKRLQERSPELIAWGIERVDEIIEAFQEIAMEEKINNEIYTPDEVAQIIVDRVNN